MMKGTMLKVYTLFKRMPQILRSIKMVIKNGGASKIYVTQTNDNASLLGKRVLITGGGSGIGLSIAKKAIAQGATVVIVGRNDEKLKDASVKINSPRLITKVWDVSNIDSITKNLSELNNLLGGEFDILVNNAGIIDGTNFPNVAPKQWDKIYSVNSRAVFFLSQEIVKRWLQSGKVSKYRKIINISSQGGFVGATYPYRLTKWDVVGMTQGLALKLAPKGIIVNGIAPGIIATEMQNSSLVDQSNAFINENPLKRYALPEEIAELAGFLMSDSSNFIVGHTVVCDGGFILK
ncbi:SDR family NAD(P)-dependent oxidoreductase [Photobacterium indicum]|uniref:SDR family NAD(P)-dependent oxidoreductase n=1 Tax=Photobacterium indicum TaxID=81447 RepID=UPI003D09A070